MAWIATLLWTAAIGTPLTYLLLLVLRQYQHFRWRAKCINSFPGPANPHWLFGHVYEFPGPDEVGLTWIKDMAASVKEGVAKFWFGPLLPTVVVFHPNSVKTLLKTSEPKPSGIGAYAHILPWVGDGLLLAGGQKHYRNRRLLTPAFHFDILRPYMNVNNRATDLMLNKLEKFASRDEYFEVFAHVSMLTLDIILRCAFTYENDCQIKGETHPYVVAVNELAEAVVYRTIRPWLYPDFIFKLTRTGRRFVHNCDFVHNIADEIIQKRKQSLLEQGESMPRKSHRYLDFLDVLLTAKDDTGQGLSDREIRDEVDTFLFEGHDTTSSGISWTLYSLARFPEHQKRCQQEVDEVLAGRTSDDIEWDDLPKLKYLTMCIKEALRMHTTVPLIERLTTKDMTIEGHFLPAGSHVEIPLYALHYNADVWDEPEEYRPDRFSDENIRTKDSFAFVPFSAGPRNCIGQHFALHEMKTSISRILRRFTLTLDPKRPTRHRIVVVMKTENGMYMKATPRERSGH